MFDTPLHLPSACERGEPGLSMIDDHPGRETLIMAGQLSVADISKLGLFIDLNLFLKNKGGILLCNP